MLTGRSTDFKTLILLKFTKSIIESSEEYAMLKLEKMLSSGEIESEMEEIRKRRISAEEKFNKAAQERKKRLRAEVKQKLEYAPSIMKKGEDDFVFVPPKREKEAFGMPKPKPKAPQKLSLLGMPRPPIRGAPPQRPPVPRRRVPMQQAGELPAHLQYLKPTREEAVAKAAQPLAIDLGKLNPFLKDKNVKTIETEGADEQVNVTGTMGKKPTGIAYTEEEIGAVIDKFSKEAKIPKTEGLFKVNVGNLSLTAMISGTLGSRFIIKKII